MAKRCVVIDYGSGNVRSATRALSHVAERNQQVTLSGDTAVIAKADQLVLPGVGAFGNCYQALCARQGMYEAIMAFIATGRPFLGICVGMQLLADRGLEHQGSVGLQLISGEVRPFDPVRCDALSIPHIGWTPIICDQDHPVLQDCDQTMMYFVHSYVFAQQGLEHRLAHAHYGETFSAVVGRDNIIGTQFHPEKSQQAGLRLLSNFLLWRGL